MTQSPSAATIAIASLEATISLDLPRLGALLDENIVMRFPFSPGGIPNFCEGRENCLKMIEQIFSMIKSFKWVALQAHPTNDPELVFITGKSDAQTTSGKPYANEYVFMIRVRDGRVVEHVEYFNPLKVIASFQEL